MDDEYSWLQQFPDGKHHSITTSFNPAGEIVQWYIDICLCNGTANGVLYLDDLFLDIVVLPTGEIVLLDEQELDAALDKGEIDLTSYHLAWGETNKLLHAIQKGKFDLLKLAYRHRDLLFSKLK